MTTVLAYLLIPRIVSVDPDAPGVKPVTTGARKGAASDGEGCDGVAPLVTTVALYSYRAPSTHCERSRSMNVFVFALPTSTWIHALAVPSRCAVRRSSLTCAASSEGFSYVTTNSLPLELSCE